MDIRTQPAALSARIRLRCGLTQNQRSQSGMTLDGPTWKEEQR